MVKKVFAGLFIALIAILGIGVNAVDAASYSYYAAASQNARYPNYWASWDWSAGAGWGFGGWGGWGWGGYGGYGQSRNPYSFHYTEINNGQRMTYGCTGTRCY